MDQRRPVYEVGRGWDSESKAFFCFLNIFLTLTFAQLVMAS